MKNRIFFPKDWFCIIIALVIIGALAVTPFLDKNYQAIFYMAQKKYATAEKLWLQALGENTFYSMYRMNLALNYMFWKQPERALKEYEVTRNLLQKEKKLSVDFSFFSFFNSALSQKGLQEALDFYQKALTFRPDSVEVKTNIELLMQAQSSKGQDKDETKGPEKNKKKQTKDQQEKEKNQQASGGDKKQSAPEKEQKINKKQAEAVLKAILDQEKRIRERRQATSKRSPVVEKDW